jgi:cytokinin dehydrogenase
MKRDGASFPFQASHAPLPPFEGIFSTKAEDGEKASDDFGHGQQRFPSAVLWPRSPEDLIRVVQLARQNGLPIVARGQGHSTGGQALVESGIVVQMSSLNALCALHSDRVEVEAGMLWSSLVQTTLAHGLTPPVLPDYLHLSIGGVLSVGGIGGTSYRYGAIVDQVQELQVVTGRGQLETCSPTQQPALFEHVLAGLGQCGIIVKATLRLVPAHTHVRVFHLAYPDLAALLQDERWLLCEERFDFLVGQILPTGIGTWSYLLEAVSFFTPPTPAPQKRLLQGLTSLSAQEEEMSYLAFSQRVCEYAQTLLIKGVWTYPHPWLSVFVPSSKVEGYLGEVLANVSPTDFQGMPILVSRLWRKHFHAPFLSTPLEETFFLVSLLRTVAPQSDAVTHARTQNRQFMERNRALGGTFYPIGTCELSPSDWKTQWGDQWEKWQQAKQIFDPDRVFTAGQGVFPFPK